MRIDKRTIAYFGIVFLFLIITIGTASAVNAEGTRTRIINSDADQNTLDIYENRIVWADDRNEKGQVDYWDLYFGIAGNWDIYMYDLSTSTETQITANNSTQFNPVIYEDRIVWQDNRNGNWDIYMYDLSTSAEIQITANESNQTNPAIYRNRLVWQDNRNGNWDIYMYDLSTSTETRITTNVSNQSEPAIYGEKIVWVDEVKTDELDPYLSINSVICVYDLSTSTETQLFSGLNIRNPSIYGDIIVLEAEDIVGYFNTVIMYDLSTSTSKLIAYEGTGDPDIYEDRIVWTQNFWNYRSHVFMYNISTSTQTEINPDGVHELSYGRFPAIYGDRIVWVRNGILMFTLASAGSPVEDDSNRETGIETQITTNGSGQCSPDIYEDRIVWTDWRNGSDQEKETVYMYNLSTSKETQIVSYSSEKESPDIYGDIIVWADLRHMNADIYLYNLSTSRETQLTSDPNDQENPAIYRDRVVWEDYRNGDPNIYMYNLSTSKETRITNIITSQNSPAIYGDRIVWADERNGNWDIYMYDLSTSKEIEITTNSFAQRFPAILEDRIVWEDERNGNWDIYMYNLTTSTETQITTNEFDQGFPAIYGDRIIWVDDRSGRRDIYMYNLSTSRETRVTTNGSVGSNVDYQWVNEWGPAIYGNKVVWEDVRNGNGDIYMFTFPGSELTPVPPVSNFSASLLSGKAPLKVKFTSTSTGSPTLWKWNFGDGSPLVMEQNPVHTYSKAGIYTVKHTAGNAAGKDTEIKTNYITVVSASPKAAFSASPTSGYAPLKVTFTDKSTGSPTSWKWSFGDGTYSTSKSPVHTYGKAGKYTVSLTAKNAAGSSTVTKSGYIVVNTLKAPVAAFLAAPVSGKMPLKVQFTDKSTNSPTSWKWSFGDGTYSTQKNPSHIYNKVGKYTVALTAKNARGSSSKTISGYIVVSKK